MKQIILLEDSLGGGGEALLANPVSYNVNYGSVSSEVLWLWMSPDIRVIQCNNKLKLYNSFANTSEGSLFLPPSYVYVRSFLYLFYTLIKLYYTETMSDQASSLAPDWIFLKRLRTQVSCGWAVTFQHPHSTHQNPCVGLNSAIHTPPREPRALHPG